MTRQRGVQWLYSLLALPCISACICCWHCLVLVLVFAVGTAMSQHLYLLLPLPCISAFICCWHCHVSALVFAVITAVCRAQEVEQMKAAVAKAAAAAKQSAAVGSAAAEAAKAAAAEKAALEAVRVCSLPFVSAGAGCVVAVGGLSCVDAHGTVISRLTHA